MSFSRLVDEDRRLVILRLLAEDPDYTINDSLLTKMLPGFGHGVSADRLRGDLHWLAEQGLLALDCIPRPSAPDASLLYVARLLERGDDVAHGRAAASGVARPRPGR